METLKLQLMGKQIQTVRYHLPFKKVNQSTLVATNDIQRS